MKLITETGNFKHRWVNLNVVLANNVPEKKGSLDIIQVPLQKKNLENFEYLENKHQIISKLETKKD
jgi:hypothetical protein